MIQYTGKFCIIMLLTLPLYLLVCRPRRREAKRKWAMALFTLWNLELLQAAVWEWRFISGLCGVSCDIIQ